MPASIGVNLRVTGNCRQGGRKYMEDCFSVAYQQTEDEKDLEYAFFGIYDGHGGVEAASFAKEHLMETIIKHKNFWSDNDEDVLRAIKDGYIATHYAMWREQSKWPRTSSGLPSTAGTTASVAFIRRGKIYIGHVGDSGIILGYQEPGSSEWRAKPLTKDHKPENPEEMQRIESCGGKVVSKSGVPRVVWNRPKIGHQGPVRRSTPIDEIPFLAVARSLGDLWSYNSQINQFVVSPDPDCSVLPIDTNIHRCLIFGTDGLFNMLSPGVAVHIVQQAERHNECEALSDDYNKVWLNPSKLLVERALDRWHATKMRADNTSAVTLMLDPPGPPRAQVLKDRKKNLPESGLKIMTRYDQSVSSKESPSNQGNSKTGHTTKHNESTSEEVPAKPDLSLATPEEVPQTKIVEKEAVEEKISKTSDTTFEETNSNTSISSSDVSSNYPLKERNFVPKLRESTSFDPREPYRPSEVGKENNTHKPEDNTIQINEISSSNIEDSLLDEEGNTESDSSIEIEKDSSKCTLRSSSKKVKNVDEQEKKAIKRKLEVDDAHHQQRKSLRLSLTQKFLDEGRKPAPCTVAEEKLKKLAEEAEKSKNSRNHNRISAEPPQELENNNNTKDEHVSRKLSITQKILKSKKVTLKKKSLVKSQLNSKKLKMVFETVMGKTAKNKVEPQIDNVEGTLRTQEKRGGLEKPLKQQEKVGIPKKNTNSLSKPVKMGKSQEKVVTRLEKSGGASAKTNDKQEKNKEKTDAKQTGKVSGPVGKIVKHKKVITGKLSNFKRQSVRYASQRPKDYSVDKSQPQSVDKVTKKPADKGQTSSAKITKTLVKEPLKKVSESPRQSRSQVLISVRETRSSPGHTGTLRSSTRGSGASSRNDAKENCKTISPKGVKSSSSRQKSPKPLPPVKNTLRQRLQEKTKTLKKSVLKKSR